MSDEEDPLSLDPVMRIFHARAFGRAEGATVSAGMARGRAGAASPVDAASLLGSARRHAARGMRARDAEDHDDACLQLGIMFEHLAKAYLADLHPTLLIEPRVDFLSLLHLAGQGQRVKSGHVIKTVGMREALERIGTIHATGNEGAGKSFARRFELVLQARNGVAHIGDHGGSADEVAQLAVRGAEEILGMAGRSLSDIFGDYTDAAVSLLDEHSTAVEQLVTLRLGNARQAFAEQWSYLSDVNRDADLKATDRQTMLRVEDDDGKVALACPACERIGILSGSPYLEFEPGEPFVNDDGKEMVRLTLRVWLSADAFRCPICGLRLHGQEQLETASLPTRALVRPGTEEDITKFAVDELQFREFTAIDEGSGEEPPKPDEPRER